MLTHTICPECGVPLPADAPKGLCPRCLVRVAAGNHAPQARNCSPSRLPWLHYFGDYELLREIARGGMGVVYRARQVSLNRLVAVKMLLAGPFATPAALSRFGVEAEMAARLSHPNIVEIYEVGQHEGHHFFSMRLVEGPSLASQAAVGQPKLSGREAALLMVKVARAVHYAHQHGVLHRDLKPGNILLDTQGEPQVADFGLARAVGGDGSLTASGAVLGSPGFLAPEQAGGKASQISTATDVYGLGAVLFFLLCGRAPFAGSTPIETVGQVLEAEPPRPRRLNARVDAELETICLKCLEKEPQRRYGSAAALAEDLERWLRREPILARPASRLQYLRKWIRREPRLAFVAGLLLLSLTLGSIGFTWQWCQAQAARRLAQEYRLKAQEVQRVVLEKQRGTGAGERPGH